MLELVEDVHLALEAAWDIKAPDVPGVCFDEQLGRLLGTHGS